VGEGGSGFVQARRGETEGDSRGEVVVVDPLEEKEVGVLKDEVVLNVVEEEVEREGSRLVVLVLTGIPSNSSIHTQKRKKLSTERARNASF
jgi:hypothetical protein